MPDQPGSGGLDAETLAAYLEGQLPPESRARVEAEIAADPETYEWLVHARRAMDDSEAPGGVAGVTALAAIGARAVSSDGLEERVLAPAVAPVVAEPLAGAVVLPFYRRRDVQAAIGATLAAAAALLLVVQLQPEWWRRIGGSDADPRFAKLVAAVGEERYIEGRLTGGFKYGPLRSVTRGPGDLSSQNLALLAAAGELQKAAEADPSAENLHAWGVAQVLLGDLDGGVQSLEAASADGNVDARTLSDLAAAYLARIAASDRADDWPRALSAATRALEADSQLASALYNRALALEGLGLVPQAIEAWNQFLAVERSSGWRADAQARLGALTKRPDRGARQSELLRLARAGHAEAANELGAQFPRLAREFVEDEALAEWAAAATEGERDRWWRVASAVASPTRAGGDDGTGRAMLSAIETVAPAQQDDIRRAHVTYGSARRAFQAARYAESRGQFHSVAQLAAGQSLALALRASLYESVADYFAGDPARASESLERTVVEAERSGFHSIEARCHWMLGIIRGAGARFDRSIEHYASARQLYQSIGEADHAAVMDQLIADAYSTLGDQVTTWQYLTRALRYWADDWFPRRHQGTLLMAVTVSRRSGNPEAALAFRAALGDFPEEHRDPVAEVEAGCEAAIVLAQLGRTLESADAIQAAWSRFEALRDAGLRTQVSGRIRRAESLSARALDPLGVIGQLTPVAEAYEARGSALQLAEVYLGLGRAYLATGDRDRARAAFARGVEVVESRRSTAPTSSLRMSYFDSVWDLYAELIDLHLDVQEYEEAFRLSELSRARVLSESAVRLAKPPRLTEVAARLAPAEAHVQYVATGRRLGAWVIRPTRAEFVPLLEQGKQPAEGTRRAVPVAFIDPAQYFDRLWRPIAPMLVGAVRVYISPDGPLGNVSFGALFDPERRQFVVEDHAVALVPGARFIGHAQRGTLPSDLEGALLVASTARSGSIGLPRAIEEVRLVGRTLDIDPLFDLDGAEFLRRASAAPLIHFAGHAVANTEYPQLSYLLLGGLGKTARLLARDLESMRLPATKLVVLSGCSTTFGLFRRGEGVLSLARPFLAAGAGSVIATTGDIDDKDALRLMTAIYANLKRGMDVVDAVTSVQREAVSDDRLSAPGSWRVLSVITG